MQPRPDPSEEAFRDMRAAQPPPDAPKAKKKPDPPHVYTVPELAKLKLPQPKPWFEGFLTGPGTWCVIGHHKVGKSLLAAELALSYQASKPLFDYFRTPDSEHRGVLVVENDDPRGLGAVLGILEKSPIQANPDKFFVLSDPRFQIGPEFVAFLEAQIQERGVGLVVLDSLSALRAPRGSGCDLVLTERRELTLLDDLAKRTNCLILLIHHRSRGHAGLDWSESAAGSFSVGASTEGEIHISRYRELAANAPERLIQVRGRNCAGTELVLRFRPATLDYELVEEAPFAPIYPVVQNLRSIFHGKSFSPRDAMMQTGMSRAAVFRTLSIMSHAGAVRRSGYGQYVLTGGDRG
ncbi:MAG: AAA family ATPase [Bryobacterales bacterium]|nr:AAA family ATPase [Bryobacterales bacterium]